MEQEFYYVYILESLNIPGSYYTGYTSDIEKRLVKHNNGEVAATKLKKPWQLKNYFTFREKSKALDFEKYLKSHSGRAFVKKHF